MDRYDADHRFWQFRPIHVEMEAEALVSVEPFQPVGIQVVQQQPGRWVIEGEYGFDLFKDHHFKVLVGGELLEFTRVEDIPDRFDHIIEFVPDATHDITFVYAFEKNGKTFTHSHWIHHDMDPWNPVLRSLLARETNGESSCPQ